MSDNTEEPDTGDVQADLCAPSTKAKDMLGLTSQIIRDLLTNGCFDDLQDVYGISPAAAARSLHYVELAELRAWGIDEMIEACVTGQSSTDKGLRRRIIMAMKAESTADYIDPADAVLLLERARLMLVSELRDAVAANIGYSGFADSAEESLEDWNRMLKLAGKPALTDEQAQAWLSEDNLPIRNDPALGDAEKHQSKASLQDRAILDWLNKNKFEPTCLPSRAPGKAGAKAECRAQMTKAAALFSAKSFEIAWERLRRSGEIAGGN
jgi:hypothetical protein